MVRHNNIINFIKYYFRGKKYPPKTKELIESYFQKEFEYGDKHIRNAYKTNEIIAEKIRCGKPFMAGRYGSGELFVLAAFEFHLFFKYKRYLQIMCNNGGFFPNELSMGKSFSKLMRKSTHECDVFACWYNLFEEYFMKYYLPESCVGTFLFNFEPWSSPENAWSKALAGKKVLVIHPFVDTIKKQYEKRELIWSGRGILPDFELKTLKAVQTISGQKDERFQNWFEALEWMYSETLKIDFDIAIIGCGAYGFPLAAKIKKSGKQAIHLAGATQLLFGIKGKRWEENPAYGYVRRFFNEYWVNPDASERPQNASSIENGCYW